MGKESSTTNTRQGRSVGRIGTKGTALVSPTTGVEGIVVDFARVENESGAGCAEGAGGTEGTGGAGGAEGAGGGEDKGGGVIVGNRSSTGTGEAPCDDNFLRVGGETGDQTSSSKNSSSDGAELADSLTLAE